MIIEEIITKKGAVVLIGRLEKAIKLGDELNGWGKIIKIEAIGKEHERLEANWTCAVTIEQIE